MEKTVRIVDVAGSQTKSGNIRFVVRDEDGNEYSTFKEAIGARALELEGKRARITFHEAQRNGYTNVYLDSVEPVEEAAETEEALGEDVAEVAWKTAIEAAPYLLGERKRAIPPDDLSERMRPFNDH